MDKSLIEKYKAEMLKMQAMHKKIIPAQSTALPQESLLNSTQSGPQSEIQSGRLIALVTAIRGLYPVPNARVTVFTGERDNMTVVATDVTDQNGRSRPFILDTPQKSISLNSEDSLQPYSLYNMLVEADGYRDNIHLNIPVFSGVTSLQRSVMMLLETAGIDKGAQVFNEKNNYDL